MVRSADSEWFQNITNQTPIIYGARPDSNYPWYWIIDLSHPHDHSINDVISSSLCSIKYTTIDDAINQILNVPAFSGNKEYFQITAGAPSRQLIMNWNNSIYIDLCIPFGLHAALKLFNVAADLFSCSG